MNDTRPHIYRVMVSCIKKASLWGLALILSENEYGFYRSENPEALAWFVVTPTGIEPMPSP